MPVYIVFPQKYINQLKKNPATCNVTVYNSDDVQISYSFLVTKVGKTLKMTLTGTNTDAPALEGTEGGPEVGGATSENTIPAPIPAVPEESIKIYAPAATESDHVRGPATAKVTLIEYSDPECPYCQKFHATLLDITEALPNDVKWVYRHYPLSFHAGAHKKAEAAECAAALGGNDAFWKFTDAVLLNNPGLDQLQKIATEIGLDGTAFGSCLDSGKYKSFIDEQIQKGADARVTGTPNTFVFGPNGYTATIMGAQSYDVVKGTIYKALSK
jgi:protein-disulfide isomerase